MTTVAPLGKDPKTAKVISKSLPAIAPCAAAARTLVDVIPYVRQYFMGPILYNRTLCLFVQSYELVEDEFPVCKCHGG
jgi:hypothetical protein